VRSDDGALGSATSEGCKLHQRRPRDSTHHPPADSSSPDLAETARPAAARVSSQCRAQPRWICTRVGAPAATAPGRSVQANGAAVATAQRHGNLARSDGHKPDAALFDGATTSPIASTCAWGAADHRRRRPCGDGNRLSGSMPLVRLTATDSTGVLAIRSTGTDRRTDLGCRWRSVGDCWGRAARASRSLKAGACSV
jgi:hypothetical protein